MTIRDFIESEGIEGEDRVGYLSNYGWSYEEMLAEGLVDAGDLPVWEDGRGPDDFSRPISDEEWERKLAEAIEF
jgi:hypothetical protein